ncbi:unnamed protein product [Gongylonema pulchrum]|uniref:Raptor_N domain-containing protein n=1 Tax=Gongylonema pulchrum TaxID=637853 RepID=A0A183EAU5_9BILA|nr:unnamed protein product [Gongylonema pulchrum]
MEVLRSTAESLFSERQESLKSSISSDTSTPSWADPLQIFYTGEDPLCDLVLEGLGLGNTDLPVIVILDATVSRMCICEKPDVSAEIVAEFVADYKNGKLNMVPLPSMCQVRCQGTKYFRFMILLVPGLFLCVFMRFCLYANATQAGTHQASRCDHAFSKT